MAKKIKISKIMKLHWGWFTVDVRVLNNRRMWGFCRERFEQHFPLKLKYGDTKKVKITIGVIE